MSSMAKEKKKADKPTRFTYGPDDDVLKVLWEYHDSLEFETPYSAIIDKAVRAFLAEKGYEVAEKPAS